MRHSLGPLAGAYRHEASTAARLPSGVPAPALRWHDMCAGWVILVFDDIEGCRPDLSPNAEDLLAVLAVLAAIAAPQLLPDLAPAPDARGSWLHGWAALAAHQPPDLEEWATLRLPELAVAEKAWAAHASGSALVHGDAITGYAAAYAGYWARMCRQPDPDGVPYLRAYQRRASAAALAWTIHRWQ